MIIAAWTFLVFPIVVLTMAKMFNVRVTTSPWVLILLSFLYTFDIVFLITHYLGDKL